MFVAASRLLTWRDMQHIVVLTARRANLQADDWVTNGAGHNGQYLCKKGKGSGISWAICKSAPRSRQITTPAPHHSVFTGRMPFLPPNQQCQSTEGKNIKSMQFLIIVVARSASVLLCLYTPVVHMFTRLCACVLETL